MPELNSLNLGTMELIIEHVNEVAEMINTEIYSTWKYKELDVGAQYGTRTFSPTCLYEGYCLLSDLKNLCECLNNSKEIVEASERFYQHIKKLMGQNMKCYEFFDAEALYKDLAYIVMLAVKAIDEWDIKLSDSNE